MKPEPEVLKSQRKWYQIPKRYIVSIMLTLGATLVYMTKFIIRVILSELLYQLQPCQ